MVLRRCDLHSWILFLLVFLHKDFLDGGGGGGGAPRHGSYRGLLFVEGKANLIVEKFTYSYSTVIRGQELSPYLVLQVKNNGSDPCVRSTVDILGSANAMRTTLEAPSFESAGNFTIDGLLAGQVTTVILPKKEIFSTQISSLCSTGFLTVVLDRENILIEDSKDDNFLSLSTTFVCTPILSIASVTIKGSVVTRGAYLDDNRISLVIQNMGTYVDGTQSTGVLTVYASQDQTFQALNDTELSFASQPLPAMPSRSKLSIQTPNSMYLNYNFLYCQQAYLIFFIDPTNAYRSNQPDSTRQASYPIFIPCTETNTSATRVYDLRVISFNISAGMTFRPDRFTEHSDAITVYAINDGSALHPLYSTGFYLSNDSVITPSVDRLIMGSRTRNVRTSYATDSANFFLYSSSLISSVYPNDLTLCGNLYIGVYLDEFNEVIEYDETNNYASSPIYLECCPFSQLERCLTLSCNMSAPLASQPSCCSNVVAYCNTTAGKNDTGCLSPRFDVCSSQGLPQSAGSTKNNNSASGSGNSWCMFSSASSMSPCIAPVCQDASFDDNYNGYLLTMDCCEHTRLYCGRYPNDPGCDLPVVLLSMFPCSKNDTVLNYVWSQIYVTSNTVSPSALNELRTLLSVFLDLDNDPSAFDASLYSSPSKLQGAVAGGDFVYTILQLNLYIDNLNAANILTLLQSASPAYIALHPNMQFSPTWLQLVRDSIYLNAFQIYFVDPQTAPYTLSDPAFSSPKKGGGKKIIKSINK